MQTTIYRLHGHVGVSWAYWLNWIVYVPAEMIAAGIIMNQFVPEVSQLWWAVSFGLVVTFINPIQCRQVW